MKQILKFKHKSLTFFILLLMAIACKNSPENNEIIIKKSEKDLSIKEITKNPRLIKLETTNDNLIGEIATIKYHNNKFYILNEIGNFSNILVFNKDGKFIKQFGNVGKGPDEMDSPRDIEFFNNEAYVWDRTHVLLYDINGTFKKSICDAFIAGLKFKVTNNGSIIFFHGYNSEKLITIFHTKNNKWKFIDAKDIHITIGPTYNDKICSIENKIILFNTFSDQLFALNQENEEIQTYYKFFYDGLTPINDLYPEKTISPYEMIKIVRAKDKVGNSMYFETDEKIIIESIVNRNKFYTYLDKSTNNYRYFAKLIHTEWQINVSPEFQLNNGILGSILYYHELSEDQIKRFQLKDTDNPLLYIYSLK